jgi:hypothetical protein
MQPVPFDPANDLPPLPFDVAICDLARQLKHKGLPWKPHVGCFVWDPQHLIEPASPFPNQVYFILSLPRFVAILGSLGAVQEKLVWLPTWHQACLLCDRYKIDFTEAGRAPNPTDALAILYRRLIDALSSR